MCTCANTWRIHLQFAESYRLKIPLKLVPCQPQNKPAHNSSGKVFNSIPFALSHFCFLCASFIVSRRELGADSNIHKVDYKYRVTPVFRAWLTKYINHFVAKCKGPYCGGRQHTQVTKLIPPPKLSASTFRGKGTENLRTIITMDHMGHMFAWQLMTNNYRHVEDTRHTYLIFGKY